MFWLVSFSLKQVYLPVLGDTLAIHHIKYYCAFLEVQNSLYLTESHFLCFSVHSFIAFPAMCTTILLHLSDCGCGWVTHLSNLQGSCPESLAFGCQSELSQGSELDKD